MDPITSRLQARRAEARAELASNGPSPSGKEILQENANFAREKS